MTTEEFNAKAANATIDRKQQQGKSKEKQVVTRSQTATSSILGQEGIPPANSETSTTPMAGTNTILTNPGQLNEPGGSGGHGNPGDDDTQQTSIAGFHHESNADQDVEHQMSTSQNGDTLVALEAETNITTSVDPEIVLAHTKWIRSIQEAYRTNKFARVESLSKAYAMWCKTRNVLERDPRLYDIRYVKVNPSNIFNLI
ncbi:uncharacterized protein MELLADRAFT_118723 [Melampsora larici-populina 98AG31]|uniref:Uncharacterized protein n=1 Tax=Melampsora larici-populina (strain 98AG31 / pathotype 3-4-7) TaxID=747676 RepID=F4SEA4_MELLP|nr:uncharacterized protein MELLADRAFT_118723 [Melampsora larici-populina 98AG31]EGF97022.1 hypothetical protein MELLADRAFT_118723 [Melampsora larici-populina 98AG31]